MTRQIKVSIYLNAAGFVMTFWVAVVLFLHEYGASLEPYVAGYVIKAENPDRIFRGYVVKKDSNREVEVGCFRLRLKKLAPAIPIKYAFDVEARLSDKIPVSAYLADEHHFQAESDFVTHPVGQSWERNYCFEMPGTIADDQTIRVSGHAEHERLLWGKRWPFWRSVTPIPEFVLKAEPCYRRGYNPGPDVATCKQS